MKFCFGDIVVVDTNQIGVVVKTYQMDLVSGNKSFSYDVYVRNYNAIQNYLEPNIDRYMVRHKYLNREEMMYQLEATKSTRTSKEVKDDTV